MYKEIDARIRRILDKIERLEPERRPEWGDPMPEEEASAFEAEWGIRLPEDYRRFITTVAPYCNYGPLDSWHMHSYLCKTINKPFLYTVEHPMNLEHVYYKEELDRIQKEESENGGGFFAIGYEGCTHYYVLVVNTPDPDTYGTVWYYDFGSDMGTLPLRDLETGQPFHFLDYLEFGVDQIPEDGEGCHINFHKTFSFSRSDS